MPRKHVRFSLTESVIPRPSMVSSSHSSTSSSSPSAMSHILRKSSNYPPLHDVPHGAHPLLKPSHKLAITFDMSEPPSHVSSRHSPLSLRVLSESAFTTRVCKLTLLSPYLPWKITISALNGSYVTLRDVLEGIYVALRKNITSADYNNLQTTGDQHRTKQAYENRYRRLRNSHEYEDEKRQGIKYIDFLMGKTRFMGLSSTHHGPDCWTLSFS